MDKLIKTELLRLEKEQQIKILYAVESGSRAWGFASKDSDWDVRFLYVHHPNWYLSIDDKKDSMEVMLPNDLDFAGWELRKTLKLFRKSNPPLLEWLRSPLIYMEQFSTAAQMRELSNEYFNPKSCLYHYLHMARGNFKAYMQGDLVKMKKYFYVLRPLLACKWIEQHETIAPMEFEVLVESHVKSEALKKEIDQLLERKKRGDEMDLAPRIDVIHEFLDFEIQRLTELLEGYDIHMTPDTEKLNVLFRDALNEVWSS
ncbi:MAG: nucleotidyltransferase domain-containing protein [Cytophagales bacterium]|nr:nucleotidyltransferase domain-containing protein [Cytophagales bacterium]